MNVLKMKPEIPLPSAGADGKRQSVQNRFVEQIINDPSGKAQRVQVNLAESPLSWLRARGMLSERLYLAGDRLREDWEHAGLGPQVTMRWDGQAPARGQRRAGGGGLAPAEYRISAKHRFDEAMQKCGPGLSDIAWRVVCAGEGLAAAEKAMGWPSRAAKLVLCFALERVAEYYRIA